MSAPTVDLSLFGDDELRSIVGSAGGNDPWHQHDRLVRANPDPVSNSAASFTRGGASMDHAFASSISAQIQLGTAFTISGAPVLDRDSHLAKLPTGFRDAGTQLVESGRRVDTVATDLTDTRGVADRTLTTLTTTLADLRQKWADEVAAATGPDGLIPTEAVPGLVARRDQVSNAMLGQVRTAGGIMADRIASYEQTINAAIRIFADQGLIDPADVPLPPPGPSSGVDPATLGVPTDAGFAADPINTATGNFVEVETDLSFTGLLAGLTITRTYNSRSSGTGGFGPRWSSWASARLTYGPHGVEFTAPDGQRGVFPRTADGFGPAPGIEGRVERVENGLVLVRPDGRRWEFDTGGRPRATSTGPGTTVHLTHDGGRLVELAHERGRTVTLRWEDDRIVEAACSDGRTATYRYDDVGHLVEAAGQAGPRRYGIDDHGLIATVTDADGVVEVANTYDHDGRVTEQHTPFGRDVRFRYASDRTTVVTDGSGGPVNTWRHDAAGRLTGVTDGHGNTLTRIYDAQGRPVRVVERGGAVTVREFDERGRLTRRVPPSGTGFTFTYDEQDRLVAATGGSGTARFRYSGDERIPAEILDPEGGTTRVAVSGGVVTEITDPDGVRVSLAHDADGNVVAATDALGHTTSIDRDAAGRPVAVATPAGLRTTLAYDQHGLLTARTDPDGATWAYAYTASGRPMSITDPLGATTLIRHGDHGERSEVIDALGGVTALRYDLLGNLADVTTPDGTKVDYRYDALSRLSAWTDATGGTWLREYDPDGHLTAAVDPTGVRLAGTVNAAGHVTALDDGSTVTTFSRDDLGRTVAVGGPDGTVAATFDRCGRRTSVTATDGGVTRFSYTEAGRLRRVVSPEGRVRSYTYDVAGRLTEEIDGTGARWTRRYDTDGRVVARVLPSGLVETVEHDGAGRVGAVTTPGQGTAIWSYDACGRVVTVGDPLRGVRRFSRDAMGRVVETTDPLGAVTRYGYDAANRLTSITDPLGAVTRRSYDEAGRLTAETDPLGRTTSFVHDAAGRLVERTDATGAVRRFTHDVSGRLARLTAGDTAIGIERDAAGRPITITETGRTPIHLRYDAAGRLTERRGRLAMGWTYDGDGLRTALVHPDGTRTRYTRDAAGRTASIEHPLLGRVELARDADGRLTEATGTDRQMFWLHRGGALVAYEETVGSGHHLTRFERDDAGRIAAADGRAYAYDAGGQLVAAGEHTYAFDAAGRLVTESGPDGTRSSSYDAAGQLERVDAPDGVYLYAYDAAGRRTREAGPSSGRAYAWDALDRLTAITTGSADGVTTRALDVDALGELTAVGGTSVAWDSTHPTAPLAWLGDSPVVGLDRPWVSADPWGSAADEPGVGFRGELTVDGLAWLRHRTYQPATRSFLLPDPLPPVPGTPYAANTYHYAGNDPVHHHDPLGLRPVTDAQLEGHNSDSGGWLGKLGHGILDVAGLVPGVGEIADLANAAWYAAEGDYASAALSTAAAIPLAGWGATAGKALRYANEVVEGLNAVGLTPSSPGQDDVTLYRGMRPGPDGAPQTGESAATLGARRGPGQDIQPDQSDLVHPGSGGMSVNTSPTGMPEFRRPPAFGGTGKYLNMYSINSGNIGPDLRYVPDGDGSGHGTLQPAHGMTWEQYQDYLHSTRNEWSEVHP